MKPSAPRLLLVAALLLASSALALNPGLGPPPASVDRSTPLATVDGFLRHGHARDFKTAAHYLDLSSLPEARQAEEGARLARRLKFVLDRKLWFDFDALSKDPKGHPEDGPGFETLGAIPLGPGSQQIRLQRQTLDGGARVWVFSADTVRAVDLLYEAWGAPLGERLPDFMFIRIWVLELWQWLGLLLLAAGALLLGFVFEWAGIALASRVAKLTRFKWDDQVFGASKGPLRLLAFSGLWALGTRWLLLPPPAQVAADVLSRTLVIVSLAWFLLRFLRLLAVYIEETVTRQHPEDLGRIRGLQTQITILRHVLDVAIIVVAIALSLMQFEVVRSVGVSLLASAGIAGLVIGLAAQKSISTLLAGIQLSITQPVRIGDTVIVEGEWGTIEELTLTYVVVKVWDLRRLVIPMTYFLDRPFQNWSKKAPAILGTVEVRTDFRADVDAFRAELKRILENEGKPFWDGAAQGVQVTGADDRTLLLRALVSAANAGNQWQLVCLVREKLFAFMRDQHPDWLPLTRAEADLRQKDPRLPG